MNEYLLDLVERIRCDDKLKNSDEKTSWKALREAELLTNIDFIEPLKLFITQEANKKTRDAAYFILGKIAKNKNCEDVCAFLIFRVDQEKDKYVISSMLDRIADLNKPVGIDLQPIIKCLQSKEWLIRQAAIRAFSNCSDPRVEDILIEILENPADNTDLIYANATLNKIGTKKSIPYLEKMLKSRNQDVKGSAKLAIEKITERG